MHRDYQKGKGMTSRFLSSTLALILAMVMVISATMMPLTTTASDADDVCATMLVPMLQRAGMSVEQSAPALACRQDNSGEWFMPEISSTADGALNQQLNSEGKSLIAAVDRMSTDSAFANSLQFVRSNSVVLVSGAGGAIDRVDLSSNSIGAGPNWLNNVRTLYNQSMKAYLTRTAGTEAELVYYMQWFMARRDSTLITMSGVLNPMAQSAFLSTWGYQQFPWPWQLADQMTIAEYTAQNQAANEAEGSGDESADTNATLVLTPSTLRAQPGETVNLQIHYPRLQGIHSVAFMASAEHSTITNIPMFLIDLDGAACSQGTAGDPVPPADRALDLATQSDALPSSLTITVVSDAQPGDQLNVCVEMTGFAAGQEVFSWNAIAILDVMG